MAFYNQSERQQFQSPNQLGKVLRKVPFGPHTPSLLCPALPVVPPGLQWIVSSTELQMKQVSCSQGGCSVAKPDLCFLEAHSVADAYAMEHMPRPPCPQPRPAEPAETLGAKRGCNCMELFKSLPFLTGQQQHWICLVNAHVL